AVVANSPFRSRAGDGNRTHIACLEGRCSTTELHPREIQSPPRSFNAVHAVVINMGGAGFEPAKAVPPDLQSGPFGRLGIHPSWVLSSACPDLFQPCMTGPRGDRRPFCSTELAV